MVADCSTAAGFSDEGIVEIIAHVTLNLFTSYVKSNPHQQVEALRLCGFGPMALTQESERGQSRISTGHAGITG